MGNTPGFVDECRIRVARRRRGTLSVGHRVRLRAHANERAAFNTTDAPPPAPATIARVSTTSAKQEAMGGSVVTTRGCQFAANSNTPGG